MATRTIKFNGFATASAVTIAAALSGGPSDSATTGTGGWGVSESGSADIVVARRNPGRFAPDGIFFEIVNLQGFRTEAGHAATGDVYKPQRHEIEVFWDFGDAGARYAAPVSTLDAHKDRNTAKGHRAAHVYRTAGSYTVTAFLVEMSSGITATATLTLTGADAVLDPDDVFTGTQNIYINSSGNYANAPIGAAKFTSMEAARSAGAYNGKNTRVILASGHSETLAGPIGIGASGTSKFVCAEPGAAVRPVIRAQPSKGAEGVAMFENSGGVSSSQYMMLQGFKMQGTWDTTTETGDPVNGLYIWNSPGNINAAYFLTDDMHGVGLNAMSVSQGNLPYNGDACTQIVHDCHFTDWINFGVYVSGPKYTALLGNRMTQNVDALAGGGKTVPPSRNNHGPIRMAELMYAVIDGCDLFSRTGWFVVAGYRATQPCLRINTSAVRGAETDVARCAMEGGDAVIQAAYGDQYTIPSDVAHNLVIDANVLVSCHMTAIGNVHDRYGGLTLRNTLMIGIDIAPLASVFNPKGAVVFEPTAPVGGISRDAPVRVYMNTYVNLLSPQNDSTNGDGARPLIVYQNQGLSDVTIQNNVVHQPNARTSDTTFAPLDTTPLFAPREKGYRDQDNTARVLWPQYATPAGTVVSAIPQTGSEALGAALTGLTSYSDIRMQPRPVYPSMGAWES